MANCKAISFILFFVFKCLIVIGQDDVFKYVIYFADKDNSPYAIERPDEYLSQAALDRRVKYNIPIHYTDLPVNNEYLENLFDLGYTVISNSRWLNAALIETDSPIYSEDLSEETYIKDFTWVSLIREGGRNEILTTEHQYSFIQTNPFREYGEAYTQINMMNGQFLHRNGFKGEEMLIAVLDAGFNNVDNIEAFERLRTENRIIGTMDFVDYDQDVYHSSSHGTSVLSTMAGVIENEYLGTAPKANYLLIRTEDTNSEQLIEEYNYVLGLEYADQMGANIATVSLGYTTFNQVLMNHDTTELDGNHLIATVGADIAASKGILVINSAGNKGNNPWKYISFPSDADSVFTIGAVDVNLNRANFSGIGYEKDGTIKPNVMALGVDAAVIRSDGSIGFGNGTSYSTPILAGLVACLWQVYPEKNNMEIIKAIEESSSQSRSPDNFMGYGIPDFQAAFALLYQSRFNESFSDSNPQVFPNPFSNSITLTIPATIQSAFKVTLINDIGQTLYSEIVEPGNRKTIDLSFHNVAALNKGLYFLQVKTNDEVFMFKMIKV